MAFELARVDRLQKTYDLAARLPNLTGPFTAADVALLPPRTNPTSGTVWVAAGVTAGVATVLFAGPDASSTGAVVVTGSADLWLRVTVGAQTDAAKVERITLLGGGAVPAMPPTVVSSVNGASGAVTIASLPPSGGAGGALSGAYPDPGLNVTAVDTSVAARVNDPASQTTGALRAAYVPLWTANETVAANAYRLSPDGTIIKRTASGTTRATWDATEQAAWTVIVADEQVRDVIGAALVAGTGVTIAVDDAANTITISATGGAGGSFDAALTQIYNTTLTAQPATGQPVAALTSVANLAPGWTVMLGSDVNTAERRTVLSIAGNNVTFTANITGTHPTTEQVSYSNKPIDADYLTVATYQQVTGGKDLRGLVRYERPVPATPGVQAYDYFDLANAVLRSRAAGGGGIVAKANGDQTDGIIDWIHAGTTAAAGYLIHFAHALNTATGTLIGLGIQGNGGSGLLIAKDGPKGRGIYLDQKGVVTDPAAQALFGEQASRFADLVRFQMQNPGTAPLLNLLATGHTPWPDQVLQQWQGITAQTVLGYVAALSGMLVWQQPIIADASKTNTGASLRYKGRGIPNGNQLMLDELGPHAGGTTDAGPALRLYAVTGSQHYSGQIRMSKNAQGLHLAISNGASRIGGENMRTVLEAVASAVRTTGVDQQSVPLAIPSGVGLTVGGTPGTTTYGYRVAAVNAKGTTIASATTTTATGPAALTTTDKITVAWSPVVGADSYKVYGRTSGSELLMATLVTPARTVADAKMNAATTRTVTDVATTANSNTITSATAAFTSDDVGRRIQIPGQGYNGNDLDTTITSVTNATTAVMAFSSNSTGTGRTATISAPALTILDSATAAFTAADIGKSVEVTGAGSGSTILYALIDQYISGTRVVLDRAASVSVAGASMTIRGGTVPLSFVDDGTVAPAGALPGNPAGQTAKVTPWVSQTADVAQWQDNAATPATTMRVNKNGRLVLKAPTTAPALGDLADGEVAFSTDATGNLIVTSRVAGALKTATITVA